MRKAHQSLKDLFVEDGQATRRDIQLKRELTLRKHSRHLRDLTLRD